LQDPASRLSAGLPLKLADLQAKGCRVLSVGGREVLEVCFFREGGEFHFYVGRRQDFNIPEGHDGPMLVVQNGLATLTWADASNVYVVAGAGDGSALKALL